MSADAKPSRSDVFKPFQKEAMTALKDAGKKLGKAGKWYLDAVEKIEKDAQALTDAMAHPATTPEEKVKLQAALDVLIPGRKKFILAAVEAEVGTQVAATAEVALDIGGRLLAAAAKHFLL